MVAFVNVLFVPVISLWLYEKQENRPLQPTLELLFRYCVFAALNIPAARVFVVLAALAHVTIVVDSGYYTIAALISAVLLPYAYIILTKIHVEIEVSRHDKAGKSKNGETEG